MGGFEILMVLVGAAIGAGVVYWWQENRINRLEKDHKRALRKMVESVERNYAERSYTPPPVNTQAAPSAESQGLLPTIMQVPAPEAPIPQGIATPSAVAVTTEPRSLEESGVSPAASLPTELLVDLSDLMPEISEDLTLTSPEQTAEMLLPETYLEEPSQQITEAQPLLTQIFDEPPFEIEELTATIPNSPTATLNTPPVTLTQSNKITTKIATWGQLAHPRYIPQLLEYANHPNPSVREQVATGLGQIAVANAMHAHTPQVIPVLERLSRDRHLETRYQAIITLGQIKSDRVIPILTSALREPSTKLVKAASSALNKLKYYSTSEPEPLDLPKKVVYKKPLR